MAGRLSPLTRDQVPIERDDIAEFYVGLHPALAWLVVRTRCSTSPYEPLVEELNWEMTLQELYRKEPEGIDHFPADICDKIEKRLRGLREQDVLLHF